MASAIRTAICPRRIRPHGSISTTIAAAAILCRVAMARTSIAGTVDATRPERSRRSISRDDNDITAKGTTNARRRSAGITIRTKPSGRLKRIWNGQRKHLQGASDLSSKRPSHVRRPAEWMDRSLTPAADPRETAHLRSRPPPNRRFSRVSLARADDPLRGAGIGRGHEACARRRPIDRAVGDHGR